VSKLNNRYLHLAGNVTSPTALVVAIINEKEEPLSNHTVAIEKAGCFRVALNQTNSLKPGKYQLQYQMQQKKYTLPFQIK
jgi:hypothetical protein